MKSQTAFQPGTPELGRKQLSGTNPRVVFLPFSETMLDSARRNMPCWRQEAEPSHSDSSNYPAFDQASDAAGLTLVPFDQEWMSPSILKRGHWEPVSA